jgi:hypothetical protein
MSGNNLDFHGKLDQVDWVKEKIVVEFGSELADLQADVASSTLESALESKDSAALETAANNVLQKCLDDMKVEHMTFKMMIEKRWAAYVLALQIKLKLSWQNPWSLDGLRGKNTKNAVEVRQQVYNKKNPNKTIEVNWRTDKNTLQLIIADTSGSSNADTSGSSNADTSGSSNADTSGSSNADTSGSSNADTSGSSNADTSGSSNADTSGSSNADTSGSSNADTSGSSNADTSGSSNADTSGSSNADTSGSSNADTSGSSNADTSGSSNADTEATTNHTSAESWRENWEKDREDTTIQELVDNGFKISLAKTNNNFIKAFSIYSGHKSTENVKIDKLQKATLETCNDPKVIAYLRYKTMKWLGTDKKIFDTVRTIAKKNSILINAIKEFDTLWWEGFLSWMCEEFKLFPNDRKTAVNYLKDVQTLNPNLVATFLLKNTHNNITYNLLENRNNYLTLWNKILQYNNFWWRTEKLSSTLDVNEKYVGLSIDQAK